MTSLTNWREPVTDPVARWLALKRQQLLITRELESLRPVAEQLLNDHSHDAAAKELGLELTRPDRTVYHYARDPELQQLQEQLAQLSAQVRQRQECFRQECVSGMRQLDLDFSPQRQLTVQLRMPVLLH
jgi:hypothetical protein